MRHTITNNAPVSAFAAAGVCTVKAAARTRAITLPVVSQLAARFPQVHQAQISAIKVSPKGAYMGPQINSGVELDGVRGVPPRGRPV
jgi:hypothetical protein